MGGFSTAKNSTFDLKCERFSERLKGGSTYVLVFSEEAYKLRIWREGRPERIMFL